MDPTWTTFWSKMKVCIQYDCSQSDGSSKKLDDVYTEKDVDIVSYRWRDLNSDLRRWATWDSNQHIVLRKELKMVTGERDLVFGGFEKDIVVHASVKDKNKREPLGLENRYQNCYANSVLQCLKATEIFPSYLAGDDYGETCPHNGDWCLSCCLRSYFQIDLASSTYFYPSMILNHLEEFGGDYKEKGLGYEFDATDFLSQVLVRFASDLLKHPTNKEINDDLFAGTLRTKLACECGNTVPQNDIPFQLLEIGIKPEGQVGFKSLKECMDSYTKNPPSYPCERCLLPKMSDQIEILAAPRILIISLGRVVSTSGVSNKLEHDVACPMVLDIAPYMTSGSERGEHKYELYGVIVHEKRSAKHGHYFCYTKHNQGWYIINDLSVVPFPEEEVESEAKQSSILFYRRKLEKNSDPHGDCTTEQCNSSRMDPGQRKVCPPSDEVTPNHLSGKLIKGRFLNNCLASHQRLLREYFIVQDRRQSEIIEDIKGLLDGCTSEKHTFCVPSLGKVVYDYELMAYCHLKEDRSNIYCSTDEATKKKAKQIYELLKDILAHFSDKSVDKRGLRYEETDLYPEKKDKIEDTLDLVCILLRSTRWSLGVRLSSKGLIIGPVVLSVNGHSKIDCSGGKSVLIPHDAHLINKIERKDEVRFLLVLEKDTIMSKLEGVGFHKKYKCILLCGKGHSDVATRGVAHKLAEELQIPVYGLGDYNPNGALIILTYKNGSRGRAFDNLNLTVPKLQWIGMESKHCYGNSSEHKTVPRGSTVLTEIDHSILRRLERDLPALNKQDLQSVQTMMQRGFGMNIEQRYSRAGDIINLLATCIPEMQGNVNQSTDLDAATRSQSETRCTKRKLSVEKSAEDYRTLRARAGKMIKKSITRQSQVKRSK